MNNYFEEETHTYYCNGVATPSVTEIADPISFKRLNDLPKHILERARERGTIVHESIEEYLLTGELEFEEINSDYIPYIENFITWYKTYRPKILFTEFRMYSEEFCGTCDLICEIDKKIYIIDYKITSVIDKKSLSVQLEGYKRLAKIYGIDAIEFAYLHLKKDDYVFKSLETNARWFDILLEHNKLMKESVK